MESSFFVELKPFHTAKCTVFGSESELRNREVCQGLEPQGLSQDFETELV